MNIHIHVLAAITISTACGISLQAIALDDEPDGAQPEQEQRDAQNDDPPSLDDLLEIERQDDSGEQAAQREADEALQQRLRGNEIANAFENAIEKMGLSAELLDTSFDTGIGTQRIQEDVLNSLQQLIDAAEQDDSSSSSSSQQQQQQQENQQRDPGRQQQQQQPQQGEQRDGDSREGQPPELQEGDINEMLEETRTEWGALPQRVRDMLLQGRQERFSSMYEQLTREYYRRLAEE